jgi:chaperonin cofactor prefoldin
MHKTLGSISSTVRRKKKKTFQYKHKLKKFITTKPVLKKTLKEIFHAKEEI